jgi:adenine/guanine/hypoxanthine permease
VPAPRALLESYFALSGHGTDARREIRAGLTTFMVMAYIIFVNPAILGFAGVGGLEGKGLPFAPTLTVTCLTAGLLSIAMGLYGKYPLALAPGMGLNAFVAFELVAHRGLSWPQAMTVVFLEGLFIVILVLTRFREALMHAVPLTLKLSISVGIGLFIAFIGFFTSGFVVKPAGPLPVALGPVRGLPMTVFVIGLLLTLALMALRMRGALLVGIVATTVIAIALNGLLAGGKGFTTPGAAQIPRGIVQAPDFSTFGRLDFGLFAAMGGLAAALAIFSMMLSDFFDTIGTVIGVGEKAGFVDRQGRMPRLNRVLLVDSLGAMFGGWANASTNTTYVESAAGVADGGRTGLVSVVVGGAVPAGDVVRAAGRRDPRPGHRASADPGRLLHDDAGSRDPVGRRGGGAARVHDHAGHAVHVVDQQRHRRRVHHLRADQAGPGQGRPGPPAAVRGHRRVRPLLLRVAAVLSDRDRQVGGPREVGDPPCRVRR